MAKLYNKKIGNNELLCYSERGALSYIMTNWIFRDENINQFLDLIKFNNFNENGFESERKVQLSSFKKFYSATEVVFGNKKGFGSPDGLLRLEMQDGSNIVFFIEMKIDKSYKKSCDKEPNSSINNQFELKMKFVNKILRGEKKVVKSGDKTLNILNAVKELVEKHIKVVGNRNHKNIYFLSITFDKSNPFSLIKGPKDMKKYLPCYTGHGYSGLWKVWQNNMCWISSSKLLDIVFKENN